MLPLMLETGIEIAGGIQLSPRFKLSGKVRKSILTNLTDYTRLSDSVLPHVHTDWPLYDLAGQSGHIPALTLSYFGNIAPGLYGRAQAGLLEPFLQALEEKFSTNQHNHRLVLASIFIVFVKEILI